MGEMGKHPFRFGESKKKKKIQPGTEETGIETERREKEAATRAVGQTGP